MTQDWASASFEWILDRKKRLSRGWNWCLSNCDSRVTFTQTLSYLMSSKVYPLTEIIFYISSSLTSLYKTESHGDIASEIVFWLRKITWNMFDELRTKKCAESPGRIQTRFRDPMLSYWYIEQSIVYVALLYKIGYLWAMCQNNVLFRRSFEAFTLPILILFSSFFIHLFIYFVCLCYRKWSSVLSF